MTKHPFELPKKHHSTGTVFCFAYEDDLDQAYAFYCARYENISFEDFMQLGYTEFCKKLNSIPKDEPLHEIIKSRTINIGKIKDKEERKYWRQLKKINKIPDAYLSNEEVDRILSRQVKENKLGGK